MFVTKAWGQRKDREVGTREVYRDTRSLATQPCMPGPENWVMGWSDCQKIVMSEGLFVPHFLHGPQILSFPSAQTYGGSDVFTPTWRIRPASFPLPWAKPQLHSPNRLSPEIVFGFSVALSWRQEVDGTGGEGLRSARFPPPTNLSTCKNRKSHELIISTGSFSAFPVLHL